MNRAEVLRAADAQMGRDLGGLIDRSARDRRAFYDRRLRAWVVEYDTDPAIYYLAIEDGGSIRFDRYGEGA